MVFGGSADQASENYGFLHSFRGGSADRRLPTGLGPASDRPRTGCGPASDRLPNYCALGAGKMADFRKMMQKPMVFLHLFSLGGGPPGRLKIDEVNSAGQFSETMAV